MHEVRRPQVRPLGSVFVTVCEVAGDHRNRHQVGVFDERVREVIGRLEAEELRRPAVPVAPATGCLLYALVAPYERCEVLEIGGGKGYSTIWLAAGARVGDGRITSLERDRASVADWHRNINDAGLGEWAELIEGDAFETLANVERTFSHCFLDAAKESYEDLFRVARRKLRRGAIIVADNVLSHSEILGPYSKARQADASLASLTLPLDRGVELTVVLE
jgi:predicted O-methyltransferase YrrM